MYRKKTQDSWLCGRFVKRPYADIDKSPYTILDHNGAKRDFTKAKLSIHGAERDFTAKPIHAESLKLRYFDA